MSELLDLVSARHDGLIAYATLRERGLDSHSVDALIRRGELVRTRRGIYVSGELWRAADPDQCYRLFVLSTALASGRPLVLSHASAAVMHGLPHIGTWPRTVHTIDPDAFGGSTARFTTSHRGAPASEPALLGGIAVTLLPRTLVDVAASTSFLVGVTMIDHALRVERERAAAEARRGIRGRRALTREDLFAELVAVNPRAGARLAERAIAFGNGLSANGGESLSRVRMFQLGFEVPELQVGFPAIDGHDYWVDFYWRRIRKIGEFDGKHKCTRGAVLGDRDPGEVVWEEKRREDALRHHSNSFDRWDWATALSPQRFHGVRPG
ncbi:hypothetical protein E3O53_07320 [Cryobacterium sp. TMT2-18-3]|uniref:type IV toxin-antitoxin system AbiEi family antitoxin domain-containing protein n=1 Tax=unclassified Cryobacterium TaxID=2649013 RepID=UPI00106D3D81|nr:MULTISPECIES: type IV toxin-antitoxin system AbiEi family antitoxin domain-containing protein [unclassified Cryobacterium]TFC31816.1 hypothetical protein E3O22_01405 [Cryobacterium sp. TMT2-18-2]TFC37433.1 hypothetical protein E3O18_05180 [Cryobacterium sp. TMT2-42-4]TFC64899.1 hypothetical protein E3O53_07320 [Cryobacterium sp. TMT2-18-3]